MSYPVFYVPAGDVLPIMFSTYDGGTGASVTMTGLAVSDVEIYKDGGTTQRASDAGYTLLDTDGIDFDSLTGIHGFSIDTSDDTDTGFYAVGAWYTVVVSAITVDSQTVNFIAAQFRIMAAEGVAGVPDVNVTHWGDTAISTPPAVNATQISGDGTAADNAEAFFDGTGYAGTNNVIPTVTTVGSVSGAVGSVTGAVGSVTGNVGGNVAGSVASVAGNVDGNVTGSVGSLAAQAKTDVNAEVLDVFNTDTFAEPGQGTPAATATIVAKLGYLYKAWRNKMEQTATETSLYNDDGSTVGQKSTVSDDDTTFTRGEWTTGA